MNNNLKAASMNTLHEKTSQVKKGLLNTKSIYSLSSIAALQRSFSNFNPQTLQNIKNGYLSEI